MGNNLDHIVQIDLSDTGLMTVNLPSGVSIDLPDLVPLDITTSSDNLHQYQTESLVGYSAGNGDLGNILDLPPSLRPTTYDNAFLALRHKPAPSWEDLHVGEVVSTGDVSYVPGLGSITHYVYPEHGLIVNVTNSDHQLHPGIVVRYLHEEDGQFYIVTEGVGTGPFRLANELFDDPVWGAVDFDVQQLLNVFGETEIPENFKECFLAGTMIDMWPVEAGLRPGPDGIYDQAAVLANVWKKPIEQITPDDWVLSFDKDNNLVPGKVTRTFTKDAKIILDFHGTFVTPGHVYYRADSTRANRYETLIDILRDDGVIELKDGRQIRATTGCKVGSPDDQEFWAFLLYEGEEGGERVRDKAKLRMGTRWMLENGQSFTMRDYLRGIGAEIIQDGPQAGYVRQKSGMVSVFAWVLSETLPKPEDYMLARSGTTLEEIYRASEWEGQRPSLPAPLVRDGGPVRAATAQERSKMGRNVPIAMRAKPDKDGSEARIVH
ncbi:MAG: hypothetical protein AAGJ34_00570 [Pseudomonadota bacterium]